tara:strand:+ start:267 stop:539 length:273 start_codon:yes stop_codon:yes gene_type:complete
MNNININDAIKQLKEYGIDPSSFDKKTIKKLLQISSKIKDPSQMDSNTAQEILKSLSNTSKTFVNLNKIGRNEKCPCGSNKKYKKCCENI